MKICNLLKYLKISFTFLLFLVVIMPGNLTYAYDEEELYHSDWVSTEEKAGGTKVFLDSDSLADVHISYTSGTFRLLPTDGKPYVNYAITKRGTGDIKARINVVEEKGMCKIFFQNDGLLEGECEYYIDLYVPESVIKTLKVEMKNGNAYIKGISCDELTAGTQSGDMVIDGVEVKKVILSAASGNIAFQGSTPSMIIDVTSGNIKASTKAMLSSLICDITSGCVDLAFPDSEDGYKLIFTRTSGYIESDFGYEKFWTMILKNWYTTYGDKKGLYYVDITSGKLVMNKSE